ncbi:hypothetical protein J1N35_028384 [Gossypium stocksii]|uniref:Uncharacterized protein n=1 Tax=Gossypium stocksii TaxID=47602 RepID=A0A9D3ZSG2_9ROSI|nr:hypothetical protein J1N35_028384 [Gossypium stocksii]
MQLVDDDNMETMIVVYCSIDNIEPTVLFAELEDVESRNVTVNIPIALIALVEEFSDPDVDEVLDDINDEGDDNDNANVPPLKNLTRGIIIYNEPLPI